MVLTNKHIDRPSRLCLAVIIALPVATPAEFKNSASYALGDFTNRELDQVATRCPLDNTFPS